MSDAPTLSRLLFVARESIDMFAVLVENVAGQPDLHNRQLVAEIDAYRAARGWNLHGFGGEVDEVAAGLDRISKEGP